ncbi:MAG: T9SS type A sorting domain-containing protein, partial [Flavobacteriales bacterium]|nr:T9SS type A sorting domain-containing protein [Flavobacteriales bacterium]
NKVYAAQAPGTGKYQFEFSDPDFGFRRRIAVSQRYVKFSQLQTNPLVAGTHYFVRARRDADGDLSYANENWGSGCEMGLDPTAIPGCGQLIDDIGSPTHSCGVTKSFGYSDKVWAQPVLGALQYRFRFAGSLDPDGPNGPLTPVVGARLITQASYVRVLNWATYTLLDGETYDVTVEVFVNGSWSGFCGPICQVTIDNPPAFGGRDVEVVSTSDVQLYPNPVNDGNVNLVLNGLTGAENIVTVDIYDVFGKRVFARTIGTEGATQVSTVLELGTGMASGVYMVDITMGDRKSAQRLTIQ